MARQWTTPTVNTLRRLCEEKKPLDQIARVLHGFPLGYIIVQARRLGFELDPENAAVAAPQPAPRKIRPLNLGTFPPPKECLWPIGDPREENFHFCSEPTEIGMPYCSSHCAVAYYKRRAA
jgi:GcrA cell cycle regulator